LSKFVIQKNQDITSNIVAKVLVQKFHSIPDLNVLNWFTKNEPKSKTVPKKTQTGA